MIKTYSKYRYFKNKIYKIYKVIDIVLGKKCNFSCKYCYQDKSCDKSDISKYNFCDIIKYIKEVIKRLPSGEYIEIHFMGGESLLYKDEIIQLSKLLSRYISNIAFIRFSTNGYYIKESIDYLIELDKIINNKLSIQVSNDFYLQDKNRCPNTHDIIEESIQILDYNNIFFKTNTVIPFNDIIYLNEIYTDYMEQVSKLNNKYLLDFTFDLSHCNEINLELAEIGFNKLYSNVKNLSKSNIVQFEDDLYRFQCRMYGGMLTSIDTNGDVYCCSSAPFIKNTNLCVGNLKINTYNDIERNINIFLKKYKFDEYPLSCNLCTSYCKICPIKKFIIKDNIEVNDVHDKKLCELNHIISKYIKMYQEKHIG